MENRLVIDEHKNWCAVIEDFEDTIVLSFLTKPSEIPIQGEVDEALEDVFGWETKIGIGELEMSMDDGSYSVYYGDCPEEEYEKLKPEIINYLISIYTKFKKRFIKRINADLKEYDDL